MFKAEMDEEEKEEEVTKDQGLKSRTAGSHKRNQLFENEIEAGITTKDANIPDEKMLRKKRVSRDIYRGRSSKTM